jgi:HEAT repeat protein
MNYRIRLALVLALYCSAGALPGSHRWDDWKSPKVRRRLHLRWEELPSHAPRQLPDGSEEPAVAPWPFVLYVVDQDSRDTEKIKTRIFSDTRFRLALDACKLVQVSPDQALVLPFLSRVRGLRDPSLVVVRPDFTVVGALTKRREFTSRRCLELVQRACQGVYAIGLDDYLTRYFDLFRKRDRLWKREVALDTLAQGVDATDRRLMKEVEEKEAELEADEIALEEVERKLRAALERVDGGRNTASAVAAADGGGGSPEEQAALTTFREFARDPNPLVRAAAVEDLGAQDSGFMAKQVLTAAKDVDPRVVRAAGLALARMRSVEAFDLVRAALSDPDRRVAHAALIAYVEGARDDPSALERIAELAGDADLETRRLALQALRVQRDKRSVPPLVAALEDSEPALRVLAAHELGVRGARAAVPALLAQLEAKDWSLKKAAVEALGRIRPKEAIGPLLERFEVEEGIMREVLHDALVAITGQDFRYHIENWKKWWDRYGESFRVPTAQEIEEAKRKAAKAMEGYASPEGGRRRYHKIETFSHRIVFILDISSSMADRIVFPPDATQAEKAMYPSRVKIDIAKKELIDYLATLDRSVYFNIITFAGRVRSWKDGLVSGAHRNAAIKWVARLKPITTGGRRSSGTAQKTNTYAALMSAFGLSDEAVPDWRSRTRTDTIFLVTDGVPTIGKVVEVPTLIQVVTDMNKTRGAVIHVICFDRPTGRRLRPLAESNGGKLIVRGY